MSTLQREPIAIVGIGCRFPGGDDPRRFWELLRDGRDAIREVPRDRWDIDAFYHPDPAAPGAITSRWGAFLDQVDGFDWAAFRISPREASYMDPQHRLLLEVAWEAFEDAGLPLESVAGSKTGVHVGITWNDYLRLQARDQATLEGYATVGNLFAFAANRISSVFDLRGPSVALDVTCASSLVAVHQACQSLWTGEVTMALAGGVDLMLSPDAAIMMSKAGLLSPDGRCKTLDAAANGFVRGEGAGIVVLKPVSRVSASDRVYALIRGTAVNHNGRNVWITAPARVAQEAVIAAACRVAGVPPADLQYVELYGTGTKRGDAVEVQALGAALGDPRTRHRPCHVGSVKTNIGNLGAAAGVAAVIKVALALYHRQIPPSLNLEVLNPAVDLNGLGLVVSQRAEPWPSTAVLLAGVTATSFGGTNAHAVLEAAAPDTGGSLSEEREPDGRAYLLPLSARSVGALVAAGRTLGGFLVSEGPPALRHICFTAGVGRSHHRHRLAVVGRSHRELAERLDALLRESFNAGAYPQADRSEGRPNLLFLFSGDGRHAGTPGRELLRREPAFRAAIEECDHLLRAQTGRSMLQALEDPIHSDLDDPALAEAVLFALHIAHAALWRSWGIFADAVAGYGVGEVAAAHEAGVLSLPDALRVSYYRGRATAEPMEDFHDALRGLHPQPGSLPFYSSTLGRLGDWQEFGAKHWEHLRVDPAHLDAAVGALTRGGPAAVVELGSSPVLAASIADRLAALGRTVRVLPSVHTGREERAVMLESLGVLYILGCDVAWDKLYPEGGRCVSLPPYAWQRERLWLEMRDDTTAGPAPARAGEQEGVLHRLAATPRNSRRALVLAHIRDAVAGVLNLDPSQPLGPQTRLFDAGMSSLAAVELANRLQSDFARTIPATVIFDHPTIEALADYLAREHLSMEGPAEDGETPQPAADDREPELLARLEQLSEEEVKKLVGRILVSMDEKNTE